MVKTLGIVNVRYRGAFKTFQQVEVLQFEEIFLVHRLSGAADVHAGPGHCIHAATQGRRCVGATCPTAPLPLIETSCPFGDCPPSGQLGLTKPCQSCFLYDNTSCNVADI